MIQQHSNDRFAADWRRAPRDGSLINVEFADGRITRAQWDVRREHWQLAMPDGSSAAMDLDRRDTPKDWWPSF